MSKQKDTRVRAHKLRVATADTRHATTLQRKTESHYGTEAHKKWAREVIRRAGGMCQDQNHDMMHPRSGIRLFADHVKELRDQGAPFDLSNGMARCGRCHTKKTMEERARRMRASP